jgi:hypothetical protein
MQAKIIGIALVLLTLNPIIAFSLPSRINPPGEKMILFDPRTHAWGAYTPDGSLIRSGLASGGKNWCPDIGRSCRTKSGAYRIFALGDSSCVSARFPIPKGGAPMPYCMYFNGNQALHGSPNVVKGNISHGCVRMRTADAQWLRYNFIDGVGTLVVVKSY